MKLRYLLLGMIVPALALAQTLDPSQLPDIPVSKLEDGTDGEIITWDSAGAPTTVAVGTADQVLTSNGPGAEPTFQDAAVGSNLTTKGDLEVHTTVPTRLAVGTDDYVLTADSTVAAGVAWKAGGGGGGGGNLTTKGDIEVYTTEQTRLPIGTNTQVLTADSAATAGLKWADPGGTYSYSFSMLWPEEGARVMAFTTVSIDINELRCRFYKYGSGLTGHTADVYARRFSGSSSTATATGFNVQHTNAAPSVNTQTDTNGGTAYTVAADFWFGIELTNRDYALKTLNCAIEYTVN